MLENVKLYLIALVGLPLRWKKKSALLKSYETIKSSYTFKEKFIKPSCIFSF